MASSDNTSNNSDWVDLPTAPNAAVSSDASAPNADAAHVDFVPELPGPMAEIPATAASSLPADLRALRAGPLSEDLSEYLDDTDDLKGGVVDWVEPVEHTETSEPFAMPPAPSWSDPVDPADTAVVAGWTEPVDVPVVPAPAEASDADVDEHSSLDAGFRANIDADAAVDSAGEVETETGADLGQDGDDVGLDAWSTVMSTTETGDVLKAPDAVTEASADGPRSATDAKILDAALTLKSIKSGANTDEASSTEDFTQADGQAYPDLAAADAFSPEEQSIPDGSRKKLLLGVLALAAVAVVAFFVGRQFFDESDDVTQQAEGPALTDDGTFDGPEEGVVESDELVAEDAVADPEPGQEDEFGDLPVGPPPATDDGEFPTETPVDDAPSQDGTDGITIDLSGVDEDVIEEAQTAAEEQEEANSGGFVLTGVDEEVLTDALGGADDVCLTFAEGLGQKCVSSDPAASDAQVVFVENGVLGAGAIVGDDVVAVELFYVDGQVVNVPLTPVFGRVGRSFFVVTYNPEAETVLPERIDLLGTDGSVVDSIDGLADMI